MLIGEAAVVMPDPQPMVVLARGGRNAGLLARLHEDVVWDVLAAYTREQRERPTDMGARMLDIVRAELHRRHAPEEPEQVCARCLCVFSEHDEVNQTCPDDDRWPAFAWNPRDVFGAANHLSN